ncbi:MAG: hypothetical protein ACREPQ_14385 [Rhodanobacter sp.]
MFRSINRVVFAILIAAAVCWVPTPAPAHDASIPFPLTYAVSIKSPAGVVAQDTIFSDIGNTTKLEQPIHLRKSPAPGCGDVLNGATSVSLSVRTDAYQHKVATTNVRFYGLDRSSAVVKGCPTGTSRWLATQRTIELGREPRTLRFGAYRIVIRLLPSPADVANFTKPNFTDGAATGVATAAATGVGLGIIGTGAWYGLNRISAY